MTLQETLGKFTTCNNGAGSFTLTKLWLEKTEELELSATAVSVMTALLWHYNPAKKYVYPHQETIAKRIKRSVATIKRAIAELKRAGYIVSSRTRNGNLYAFTKKFFDIFEQSESQVCTVSEVQNELCMNKEHIKEQKNNNKRAVVVSLKDLKGVEGETQGASRTAVSVSSETQYNLKEIPDILKKKAESGEIRNLQGYWASLRPAIKIEYWEKDSAEKLKIKQKAELKRQLEEQKAKELAERKALREEMEKPLNERWTREEAVKFIWNMRNMIKQRWNFRGGLAGQLAQAFSLDIDAIINSEQV